MKYKSVFDIIGPVMIGPSSSHTAGAARIGRVARSLFAKQPKWAKIHLYGSFAQTYRGHGTDVAIVGGLLDYDTDDQRIVNALSIAKASNLEVEFIVEDGLSEHPNTARIVLGDDTNYLELVGISIGGGKIEVTELNGFPLRLSGNHPAIVVLHEDRFGAIAKVATVLANHEINIGHMEVSRKEIGKFALMTIEVDQSLSKDVLEEIRLLPNISQVTQVVD
ncbi:L-serine ammonia-lyase, iron-sulfur-dependent subunit beta [Mangrovibacillus cuniculi]|uniref:L-serine deaminase n=1 Tax=Mangrovibacillus cuniculi TaxID=2593652 RepID=A0A7S8CAA9_9BACI|nr:L-serine ammonia-lyase, iron-sulfur-dependent subunit beta [Mangrovibacillus cuniculi]QPC46307.1 L-serine ammonia-lyase, iron-sulfur-dependent, subunit beta [Mangrovibacillus cuniculi]